MDDADRDEGRGGLRRLRWRLRGAWLWPTFVGRRSPRWRCCTGCPCRATSTRWIAALLVAGCLNLIAVVVARRPRRRAAAPPPPGPAEGRRDDYAGTAALVRRRGRARRGRARAPPGDRRRGARRSTSSCWRCTAGSPRTATSSRTRTCRRPTRSPSTRTSFARACRAAIPSAGCASSSTRRASPPRGQARPQPRAQRELQPARWLQVAAPRCRYTVHGWRACSHRVVGREHLAGRGSRPSLLLVSVVFAFAGFTGGADAPAAQRRARRRVAGVAARSPHGAARRARRGRPWSSAPPRPRARAERGRPRARPPSARRAPSAAKPPRSTPACASSPARARRRGRSPPRRSPRDRRRRARCRRRRERHRSGHRQAPARRRCSARPSAQASRTCSTCSRRVLQGATGALGGALDKTLPR